MLNPKAPFYYIVMILIIIFVSIMLLELYCRFFSPIYISAEDYFGNLVVFDDGLGYKMTNNFRGLYRQDYELFYSTNSYGLRDREFSSSPDKETKRILAIGDSWTFGPCVELYETWPKQLEKALNEKGIKSEVINAGVCGYSTRNYNKVLKKFYYIYHPDIAVVLTYSNDPGGDISEQRKVYPTITSQDSWLKTFLKRHSHLAKNLWIVYQKAMPSKYGLFYMADIVKRDENNPELSLGYKLYRESLVGMKEFCEANNILFFVSTIPLGAPVSFLARTQEICMGEGIDFISLELLRGREGIGGINSAGHLSPKGYHLLADIIAWHIYNKIE